jgi:rubrerythrin
MKHLKQLKTTASAKYAAYSKKAEKEGYQQIALLFKAASTAEKIHASNHKSVLEESGTKVSPVTPEFTVKSTRENLQDAIKGETYEATTMYPEFLKVAEAAGNQMALISLNYAFRTEKKHRVMYENALAALEKNTVKSLPGTYFVCPTCGNTYDTAPAERCGICMTGSEKFIKINSL